MSSEIPPTYYFDNISFNPDFYQSSSDDYLTATTGKKIFLSYPYAQGTESIAQLYSSNIDSLTPTTTFSFLDSQTAGINIGDSVVGTIKLGQNTGTSVHCGSIDCAGTNINNSVAPLTGNLSLAPSQTSGVLNIGTGARTTDGIINIGTGSTLANPINIGSASSISSLKGTVNVETIITTPTIDSTTATTNMFIGSNITTSDITIAGAQTTGILNIGTGARTAPANDSAINIGTSATGSTKVNIGTTANTTINLNATSVDVSTKVTSLAYACSSATDNLTLGANLTGGNLTIAGLQTSGDIEIGCNAGRLAAGAINICTFDSTTSVVVPIAIGNSTSTTAMKGTCTFAKQITASLGLTSAGNILTTGSGTITSAGSITGTSLVLGTGAVGCGTITSTGNISTSSASGTITAPSGGFLIGPYKNAATATASITAAGAITGTTITANNGLTLGSGQGITLSSTAYTPSSTQLGYSVYSESNVETTVTAASSIIATITNLPVGVYYVTCYCTLYTFTIGATQVVTMSDSSTGGIATSPSIPKTVINGVSTTFQTTPTLGGIVRATTNTNTLSFNIIMTSGGGQCFMSNYGYYAIKIA